MLINSRPFFLAALFAAAGVVIADSGHGSKAQTGGPAADLTGSSGFARGTTTGVALPGDGVSETRADAA